MPFFSLCKKKNNCKCDEDHMKKKMIRVHSRLFYVKTTLSTNSIITSLKVKWFRKVCHQRFSRKRLIMFIIGNIYYIASCF